VAALDGETPMKLSEYEMVLLRETVNGLTAADIATKYGWSPSTVRNQIAFIKQKAGVAESYPAQAALDLLAIALEEQGLAVLNDDSRLKKAIEEAR